uniref:EGF-like domain-containing protein n=1 Tax=Trieres chinensis TaxID=1514140 RepID=A0A7S1YTQ9_TRICV|mmetsp:Transcript_1069/g.2238  ORF Transcript_1069/g.2238 Transcript_1069/m.2238 type:complete len:303 (+) Transcript_1069:54-962(+)
MTVLAPSLHPLVPRLSPLLSAALIALIVVSPVLSDQGSSPCPITCEHGTCVTAHTFQGPYCECHAGWGGRGCNDPFVICPDGVKRCFNGSECRLLKRSVGESAGVRNYECDCSKAFGISSFAGHECEMSSTEVCEAMAPSSAHAFCTNGGRCRDYVNPGHAHPGCRCPEEFEGRHCEYFKGTAPSEEEQSDGDGAEELEEASKVGKVGQEGGDEKGGAPLIVVVIMILAGGFVMVFGLCVALRSSLSDGGEEQDGTLSPPDDVDPDGSSTLPGASATTGEDFTNEVRGGQDVLDVNDETEII